MESIDFEFEKLQENEVGVALWLNSNYPKVLKDYLIDITEAYKRNGIIINDHKLIKEFSRMHRICIEQR